jgi:hypothetical protein
MSDVALVELCGFAIAGQAESVALSSKLDGNWPTPADQRALDDLAYREGVYIDMICETPAVSLAGCRAKASVLSLLASHDALAKSLAFDVMANVPKSLCDAPLCFVAAGD